MKFAIAAVFALAVAWPAQAFAQDGIDIGGITTDLMDAEGICLEGSDHEGNQVNDVSDRLKACAALIATYQNLSRASYCLPADSTSTVDWEKCR